MIDSNAAPDADDLKDLENQQPDPDPETGRGSVMIWIGNKGYGRIPYHLSLPHQTTFGLQKAVESNFKSIERVLVHVDNFEPVLNWQDTLPNQD